MKQVISLVVCMAAMLVVAGCDTDIQPVSINEPGIEAQNPELYATYLSDLRQYKSSSHMVVFGWFDNSIKNPASQGQNILAVPDSIDFLVLSDPSPLDARELSEMAYIKEQKGTRTLYEISFAKIQESYDMAKQAFEDNTENEGKIFSPDFNTYLVDTVQAQLALCQQYGYAGVVMSFLAKTKIYMTKEEQASAIARENAFLGIANDWKERNQDRLLVLSGSPQHVTDPSVLKIANYIVIPCEDAVNASGVAYNFSKAATEGVPVDKFVPLVSLYSQDPNDVKTGYWGKMHAATGAARFCVAEHHLYKVAGLALRGINADYYHAGFVYPVVREAIAIINPTVKK